MRLTMSALAKVAVVSGANQGIGYAIAKRLAVELLDGIVYCTSRNLERGREALDRMRRELTKEQGARLETHQLDITDGDSIARLNDTLNRQHSGLDILVNNAATAYKWGTTAPFGEQAANTVNCNYFGTKAVCDSFFPLLRPHSRVVNVSSRGGVITPAKFKESVSRRLTDKSLNYQQLDDIAREFIELAKKGEHVDRGFPDDAYGVSKTLLLALTEIQQRYFDVDKRPDIIVNSCCPGHVSTAMSSYSGKATPDEGADSPVYLALLPDNVAKPKGAFVYDREEHKWNNRS